jgi:cytochrome c553
MTWQARSTAFWALLLAALCVALPVQGQEAGLGIYQRGLLPSGQALQGERLAGGAVAGEAAACMTCHRRSGLGSSEGRIVIPPIIGKYLFRPHATNVQDINLPHVPGYRSTREPYTEATLAKVIREGIGPNGRTLSDLMPRFDLNDADMAALIAYLKSLGAARARGVDDEVLHFATIITPDTSPQKRQAMLDVMQRFFADKNAFIRGGMRAMQATREIEYRVSRQWQLHVWDLTGEPGDWPQQLRDFLRQEPVLAVVSGLGRTNWQPIHQFCQAEQLPCLLPNTDLPVVQEGDFYPVYFSRGVLLEADLMRQTLQEQSVAGSLRRVVQLYRSGDIGEAAMQHLQDGLAGLSLAVENRMLDEGTDPASALAKALQDVHEGDALVLWLREPDLAALPPREVPGTWHWISGLMAGLEHAPVPDAWRPELMMSYPLDLPELRKIRMNFPLSWFRIRHIAVVDERLQTDTYIACGILAETLTEMLDSFVPDYLIERLETMVSHRLVNGYYPRLGLAAGQRFASKGGYLVRFGGHDQVVADGDWVVP